jgi:hypothetical protein
MPETLDPAAAALDAAFQTQRSRFVVGIDLGTTNCAVAYVDTQQPNHRIEIFRIDQLVDFGTTVRSDTLPSFHFELTESESESVDSRFRFGAEAKPKGIVGALARERTTQVPGRGIGSAKSWLCHALVDRSSDLLPWHSDEDIERMSPVEVSRRYLEHIRRQWDREHPSHLLSQQEVIVTLPASFDEVARQLTLEAAKRAGLASAVLSNVVLIEEPQAAFYAWLHQNETTWMKQLQPGESILVCDIGGGTTDFTLIRVIDSALVPDAETGKPNSQEPKSHDSPPHDVQTQAANGQGFDTQGSDASLQVTRKLESVYGLQRVAVGEHLMLGGDNLDLALAKHLEQRLLADPTQSQPGLEQLSTRQWDMLKAHARKAKETLLGSDSPEAYSIALPSLGSKLIAGTRVIHVTRDWARQLLVDGFFGRVPLESRPDSTGSGFQEFGLPYESEPNVHKHLAAFLWEHRWEGRPESDRQQLDDSTAARPDWVLFNGGVLESTLIRDAILDQIADWFSDPKSPGWRPGVLQGNRLDLAVAQGAAYFGMVRRGEGIRIDARLARSYYLLVNEQPMQAICVMPASALPLDRYRLDSLPFELKVGEPVRFPLFYSSSVLNHGFGELVVVDPKHMTPLPSIQTVLETGRSHTKGTLAVVLESELSEIGTLQLSVVQSPGGGPAPNDVQRLPSNADAPARRWNLEFDVRSGRPMELADGSSGTGIGELLDASQIQRAREVLDSVFGEHGSSPPKECYGLLNEAIGRSRRDWPPSMLRELWRYLAEHSDSRKKSPEHEARWLNLAGWALRPGFGYPADDWRVQTTWRLVHNKLMHRSASGVSEVVVLWRRIAGGFTAGQQTALFQDIWPRVKPLLGATQVGREQLNANVAMELLRLLGSLERLRAKDKALVGDLAVDALSKKKLAALHPALLWMIGRLGSRTPVYATLQQLLPVDRSIIWIGKLLAMKQSTQLELVPAYGLALMLLARKTGDRYRDIPQSLREKVLECMRSMGSPVAYQTLVESGGSLDETETTTIVGDALPLGFSLHQP